MNWINVDKEKPLDMQQVWVCFYFDCPAEEGGMSKHQGYAIWSDEDGWYFDITTDGTLVSRQICQENDWLACTITHWMPLPEDPQ